MADSHLGQLERGRQDGVMAILSAIAAPWTRGVSEPVLRGGLPWEDLLDAAGNHRLLWHLDAAVADGRLVPGPDAAGASALRDAVRLGIGRALARAAHCAEIERALATHGIRSAVIKGTALAVTAYGELGARESQDVDLLVSPRERRAAAVVLHSLGYREADPATRLETAVLDATSAHDKYLRDGAAMVELHWRTATARSPWRPDVETLLDRAVGGRLDPLDDLAMQATHGARHAWNRLEWLVAFAASVHRSGLQPTGAGAYRRIAEWRAFGAVELALRASDSLLGTSLAPVAPPGPRMARALGAVVSRASRPWAQPDTAPHRVILDVLDSTAARARYLAASALAPTEHEREMVRLPGPLALLYYPIRFARLAGGRTAILRRHSRDA